MSDHLERMFRLLVSTITSSSPDYLTQPFEVADLYQNILPYRIFRRELGLETNQDYELRLMELLSGAREYLTVDDRMADVLRRELESPHPDALARVAGADVQSGGRDLTPVATAASGGHPTFGAHGGAMSATPPAQPQVSTPAPAGRPAFVAAPGDTCRFCSGPLPHGRAITFCPHCGQDQTVLHCEACGSELEVGWKYCTTCGRGVAAT
jgi:hypothetical protein